MIFRILLSIALVGMTVSLSSGQDTPDSEAFRIKQIYDTALLHGQCYSWLSDLTNNIGHRLSGSRNAAAAVAYVKQVLDTLDLDSVWLQPCTVPQWVRGEHEIVRVIWPSGDSKELHALALGNSVGTGPGGIEGEVLEVLSLDALREIPDSLVSGKIVFFNRPLDVTLISTFNAYGRAVDQRWAGPHLAAEKGAVAAVVRSMTTSTDDVPHTGSSDYRPDGPNVPSVAISTRDADYVSQLLKQMPVQLFIRTTCAHLDSVTSYNVIGQINGSKHPDEIILVGGHLDSWDVGQGANDDGSGCVQAMDVMYLLHKTAYVPSRTIRCVLFMNEENGLGGGRAYADSSNRAGEFHLAAIESDAGGFLPLGFGCSAESPFQEIYLRDMSTWWNLLEPYGITMSTGGGGADISNLRSQGGMLIGMRVNSQRYFDYHHTMEDTLDKVNPRELKLGAAAMTALVSLLDKFATRAIN